MRWQLYGSRKPTTTERPGSAMSAPPKPFDFTERPAGHSFAASGGSADSLRADVLHLLNEVNCRIEHGANSNKHLEYVEACLRQILEANPPNEKAH